MEFLFKLFIKDHKNTKSPDVRKRYGLLGSFCSIFANLILFGVKLFVGTLSGSIAVTADAFNNLSDTGSGVVTLLGFTLSSKPSDDDHPFGHGRMEYISGLFVSFIILMVALSFAKTSVSKILHPSPLEFNLPMVAVLILTIPVKLWLSGLNAKIGKKIGSTAMAAASADSLNDVLSTAATILSALLSLTTTLPVDGYLGLIISAFVLYSGVSIARETLSPLLGQAPCSDMFMEMRDRILKADGVSGIHDLIIHNYGPGRYIASVHVEVPSDANLLKIHDVIDGKERELYDEMGIITTIHIDPIAHDDEKTTRLKIMTEEILMDIDPALTLHDFRVVPGETHENLIFDVTVPNSLKLSDESLKIEIDARIKAIDRRYCTIIMFDRNYI